MRIYDLIGNKKKQQPTIADCRKYYFKILSADRSHRMSQIAAEVAHGSSVGMEI